MSQLGPKHKVVIVIGRIVISSQKIPLLLAGFKATRSPPLRLFTLFSPELCLRHRLVGFQNNPGKFLRLSFKEGYEKVTHKLAVRRLGHALKNFRHETKKIFLPWQCMHSALRCQYLARALSNLGADSQKGARVCTSIRQGPSCAKRRSCRCRRDAHQRRCRL